MILRLDLPPVPLAIPKLRVTRWHAQPGETVGFGDLVVELRAEHTILRRRRTAPRHRVEVIASERAVLRNHLVPEDGVVEQGAALALLATEGDDVVAGTSGASLPFRAVADVIFLDEDLLEDR